MGRSRKVRRLAGGIAALAIAVGGCTGLSGGLDASSTCDEFIDASPAEQNQVVLDLVMEAQGGERNPLREGNALMQITSVCRGGGDVRLGEIGI